MFCCRRIFYVLVKFEHALGAMYLDSRMCALDSDWGVNEGWESSLSWNWLQDHALSFVAQGLDRSAGFLGPLARFVWADFGSVCFLETFVHWFWMVILASKERSGDPEKWVRELDASMCELEKAAKDFYRTIESIQLSAMQGTKKRKMTWMTMFCKATTGIQWHKQHRVHV